MFWRFWQKQETSHQPYEAYQRGSMSQDYTKQASGAPWDQKQDATVNGKSIAEYLEEEQRREARQVFRESTKVPLYKPTKPRWEHQEPPGPVKHYSKEDIKMLNKEAAKEAWLKVIKNEKVKARFRVVAVIFSSPEAKTSKDIHEALQEGKLKPSFSGITSALSILTKNPALSALVQRSKSEYGRYYYQVAHPDLCQVHPDLVARLTDRKSKRMSLATFLEKAGLEGLAAPAPTPAAPAPTPAAPAPTPAAPAQGITELAVEDVQATDGLEAFLQYLLRQGYTATITLIKRGTDG